MWWLFAIAVADEGMWLPEQVPGLVQEYRARGLTADAGAISDPTGAVLGAVVSVGGYCSGSFVTNDGLVITNHHCVEEYLQYNSDGSHDYGHDGFAASARTAELSGGPGAHLYVVEKIEDVTKNVLAKARMAKDDAARTAAVEIARKKLVAECEKQEDRRCEVTDYWGGEAFRRITWLEIEDVRLVYAPPEGLGQFGGEIDNWMWPRHGADFALLRAYVSPNGKLAPYHKDNVPYQPKRHLRVQERGAAPGELVMAAGFPGSTQRNSLASQLRFESGVATPVDIDLATRSIAALRRVSESDANAAAKLRAPIDYLGNGLKYDQGILDNLKQTDVVAIKASHEADLRRFIDADPSRKVKYGPAADELAQLAERQNARRTTAQAVRWVRRSADVLGGALRAVRTAEERIKPDLQREEGYQARDLADLRDELSRADKTLVFAADLALVDIALTYHQSLPTATRASTIDAWVTRHGGLKPTLDALAANDALTKPGALVGLLDRDLAALRASTDPWVELAVAIAGWSAPQRAIDKADDGATLRLLPVWLAAEREQHPGRVYPDANGTLRITIGQVEGYSPRDGVVLLPQTTLTGMVAKAGPSPFNAPRAILDRAPTARGSRFADARLGDVPVDFITSLDSTGGNSGSPTLNGAGELVGVLFDGNYESMSADWVFDPKLTRSIHADIRYILWILDGDPTTQWLVTELAGP
jgi:hypothetical protein